MFETAMSGKDLGNNPSRDRCSLAGWPSQNRPPPNPRDFAQRMRWNAAHLFIIHVSRPTS